MPRPPVDRIDGLSPTIAIDQRPAAPNPRSTVATITEIYDYLRVLVARRGDVSCPHCGTPIAQQTPAQIEATIRALPENSRVMLLAPIVKGRRGAQREAIELIQKAGLVRARVDGMIYPLEEIPPLVPQKTHDIEAVVDRIIIREGVDSRLSESVRLAVRHGDGVVIVLHQPPEAKSVDQWQERVLNTRFACPRCGTSIGEIEPRTFSFNSPYGACPVCHGLGVVVNNEEGKTRRQGDKEKESNQPISPSHGFLVSLSSSPCPACKGTRLRAEARASRLSGLAIHEITALSVTDALSFFERLRLGSEQHPTAVSLLFEITRRLDFLQRVGVDYLTLDRRADTLSGGERQRVRLATGIGSGLVGVLYLLDEPSIGLHPRDNDRLIDALRNLQELGNSVIVVEHDEAFMRAGDYLIDIGPGAGQRGGQVVAHGTPEEVAKNGASITGSYLSGKTVIPVPTPRRLAPRVDRDVTVAAATRSAARSSTAMPHSSFITLSGATANNLQNLSVQFPLQAFVCVTGVSGSGKSTLVLDTLAPALTRILQGRQLARQEGDRGSGGEGEKEHCPKISPAPPLPSSSTSMPQASAYVSLNGIDQIARLVQVDSSPIGRTPRSSAATYTGIWNDTRRVFAGTKQSRQRGYRASRFSFNAKGGRCEDCKGAGIKRIAMNFLPDLEVTCPVCKGQRFNRQTLAVRYRGKNIADVLAMSVDEAAEFFANHASIHGVLTTLVDVGLGYLALGQPATTLSGGEAQRIKLAAELAQPVRGHTLYILDEPTTGLATDDIRRLLGVLHRLVDQGNSMIVIEHNLDVIKTADWVIDLGPEGGAAGGRIVAVGTPEEIAACEESDTGRFLRKVLSSERAQHDSPAQHTG
jgi:excinuclease ABC subunit A